MSNHDNKGRFAPGNKASPGRPRKATVQDYTNVIWRKCTPEKWEGIVDRAIVNAEDGDKAAREWLEKWLVGAPVPMIELPMQEMSMLAFMVNSLKERGADFTMILEWIAESAKLNMNGEGDED